VIYDHSADKERKEKYDEISAEKAEEKKSEPIKTVV